MTRKIYRTAQGKMVDLGALQLRNENVRAVGNMGVNARGDLLDSNDLPIGSRNQQVAKQYQRQTTNVSDESVIPGKNKKPAKEIPPPPEDFDDGFTKESVAPVDQAASTVNTGLAAAIARARQVKQDPLKTPREVAQQQEGVRKI